MEEDLSFSEKKMNPSPFFDVSFFGKRLVEKGLVRGAGGNISLREGNSVYLSPSGFPLDEIKPEQYVKVNLKTGQVQKESLLPSCEMFLHLSCYRVRDDIGAVAHVHPPFSIGLGCAGLTLKALSPEFVISLGERVPLIPYFTPGSEILAGKVSQVLKNHSAVLLQNHGLVAVGKDLHQACLRAEIIEEAAKIYFVSHLLGKVRFLTKREMRDIKKSGQ